jgi:hypothetical protein
MALKEPSKFTNVCHLRTCANAWDTRYGGIARECRFKKRKDVRFRRGSAKAPARVGVARRECDRSSIVVYDDE